MKVLAKLILNLKTVEALSKVANATDDGLKDTLVDIAGDVIKLSPKKTGHNMRSIAYKLGSKVVHTGSEKGGEQPFEKGEPDVIKHQGAIYSTSGYGGYLEVGFKSYKGKAYFRRALDKNLKSLGKNIKAHIG